MNKKKVIDRLKSGRFCYSFKSLFIISNITEIFETKKIVGIQFEAGDVEVESENIKVVEEEKNYEWRYELIDKKGEHLGYIIPKE